MTAKRSLVGGTAAMYVSFYTPSYLKYADRLRDSLDRANINMSDRHIERLQSEGSWVRNCAMKAQFLWDCLERFERPLVWVDADAVVHKYTSFWSTLVAHGFDIAAHMPDQRRHPLCNSKLCSGTIFVNNTVGARDVLMDWICACEESKHALDQDVLYQVLFDQAHVKARAREVKFAPLPAELCCVFDLMGDVPHEQRVIEHFQASREMRDRIEPKASSIAQCNRHGCGC